MSTIYYWSSTNYIWHCFISLFTHGLYRLKLLDWCYDRMLYLVESLSYHMLLTLEVYGMTVSFLLPGFFIWVFILQKEHNAKLVLNCDIQDTKPAYRDQWVGKVNFVEIRSFLHVFRSFDRMWSFFILCLQVHFLSFHASDLL